MNAVFAKQPSELPRRKSEHYSRLLGLVAVTLVQGISGEWPLDGKTRDATLARTCKLKATPTLLICERLCFLLNRRIPSMFKECPDSSKRVGLAPLPR